MANQDKIKKWLEEIEEESDLAPEPGDPGTIISDDGLMIGSDGEDGTVQWETLPEKSIQPKSPALSRSYENALGALSEKGVLDAFKEYKERFVENNPDRSFGTFDREIKVSAERLMNRAVVDFRVEWRELEQRKEDGASLHMPRRVVKKSASMQVDEHEIFMARDHYLSNNVLSLFRSFVKNKLGKYLSASEQDKVSYELAKCEHKLRKAY